MLPVQCRMARVALGLTVRKLAVAAKVAPKQSFALSEAIKYEPVPSPACVKFSKLLGWSSPTDVSLGFA